MADPGRSGISPGVAAFVSGAVSVLLTVAGTLVSLRNEATKEQLFGVLSGVMYATGAATFLVLLWIVSTTLLQRLELLRSLRDVDVHVSRQLRVRRRTDRLEVGPDGSAGYVVEFDVEADRDVAVAWLAFPIFSAAKVDAPPWQSVHVRRLMIDGRDYDVLQSYIHRSRAFVEGALFKDLVMEEGVVRIPVSLEKGKSKRRVKLEIDLNESMPALFAEESHSIDISYITDEIDVHVTGKNGLEIFPSPRAAHLVEASQNKGEHGDAQESILQSSTCRHRDGIHWRSKNTKLGYRYEIKFVARREVSPDSTSG
ncbi:hypothetical protein [Lentzea sp. NBRC 102530]|uniref:hypothetical protein n=1 Tax=Lentzea sp. NBRC 102530 TaxID=3032201 RepID=UPI0024A480BC|nr:hypothetical protein [Lentzea sp. NBRC 102530]GLY48813.1 hypothetical protein Lesp01_24690 [Lentzea sp. NBRC 102530]